MQFDKEYRKTKNELIYELRNILSEPAILEQMAEECSELTQALLKKARKLRNENYTPKIMSEIDDSITEEFTDVLLCSKVLYLYEDSFISREKLERWIKRLTEDHDE